MEHLDALRALIPSYAGYDDEESRHLADKQVRAWIGERITLLDERLGLAAGPNAAAYERLLEECEFSDPHAIRELEQRDFDDADLAVLYGLDRRLIEAAGRADSVDAASASAYLDDLERLFASRYAIIGEPTSR
jgi:hypothetical protein